MGATPSSHVLEGGLGGEAVRVLTFNLWGRQFESRPGRFMLESWVVTCRCPVVYSAECWPTAMHWFPPPINYPSHYDPGCWMWHKKNINNINNPQSQTDQTNASQCSALRPLETKMSVTGFSTEVKDYRPSTSGSRGEAGVQTPSHLWRMLVVRELTQSNRHRLKSWTSCTGSRMSWLCDHPHPPPSLI